MPEGRPRDDQTPPLRILEHWRRVAWPGRGNWPHRDPSISSIGFECSALGGRHGAQNLIVVAAGKNRFEERWASCKIFRAVLESGTPAVATSAVIPVSHNILARSPRVRALACAEASVAHGGGAQFRSPHRRHRPASRNLHHPGMHQILHKRRLWTNLKASRSRPGR